MLKGNRGEWSEVYAFLYLLGEGSVYAADSKLGKIGPDQYLPIVRIIREETPGDEISYFCGDDVLVRDRDGALIAGKSRESFQNEANRLYEVITLPCHASGSFASPDSEKFLKSIFASKIKAPSSDKSDIVMQIQDPRTGFSPVCGWSIKSELGHPPTLLNAGKTTNFVFEVEGVSTEDVMKINAIDTKSKVKDRLVALDARGARLSFKGAANAVFARNQRLIDTRFPEIMAEALLLYYSGEVKACADAVEVLEKRDPLGLGAGMYEYKIKKFLAAVALGMVPGSAWDGHDAATGGYIIVTSEGDVVAFHVYNRDEFEEYLLKNTRFETASTVRHEFGSLYFEEGRVFLNLNLQVRFIR